MSPLGPVSPCGPCGPVGPVAPSLTVADVTSEIAFNKTVSGNIGLSYQENPKELSIESTSGDITLYIKETDLTRMKQIRSSAEEFSKTKEIFKQVHLYYDKNPMGIY